MTSGQFPGKQDLLDAQARIGPYIHQTPVFTNQYLNQRFSRQIYFKCENFQKAGAFKSRGACNAVFSLDEKSLEKGVATHSSGNHAQALARAAMLRNVPAYIVMPENSSKVKIEGVESYHGIIRLCKPTLEARESTLKMVVEETGAYEIHPYDNVKIIAGQATATMEVLNTIKDLDLVMAPVGGGGLLSGTALAAHFFAQNTEVIAAEPVMANDAFQSFYSGKFVPSVNPNTIADGLRTSLGQITFPLIQKYVKDIVTVEESSIVEAMKLVWERMKIIIEPSSAVPLAAFLENKIPKHYQKVCVIISGGNVDLQNLPW